VRAVENQKSAAAKSVMANLPQPIKGNDFSDLVFQKDDGEATAREVLGFKREEPGVASRDGRTVTAEHYHDPVDRVVVHAEGIPVRRCSGWICVQVVPFQIQVSFRESSHIPAYPPNSTIIPRLASYVIAADVRADGEDAGNCCVHVVPFQFQVSVYCTPTALSPPNRSTLPLALS
jgi:hypothetical protein